MEVTPGNGRFETVVECSVVGKRNTGAAPIRTIVQRPVRNIHHRLLIGSVGYARASRLSSVSLWACIWVAVLQPLHELQRLIDLATSLPRGELQLLQFGFGLHV